MKSKHLVLPMMALMAAGCLLSMQQRQIHRIEGANERVRNLIASATATDLTPYASPDSPDPDAPVDLIHLVSMARNHPRDHPPGLIAIQRQLLAMEPAALLTLLDELAAIELDDATRKRLEGMILDPLSKKDPEAALVRFKDSLRGRQSLETFMLAGAMDTWATNHLAAATAWLDREVAAGTFDPKSLDANNPVLARFEAAIVFRRVTTDPAGAKARLAALPPAMQIQILKHVDRIPTLRPQDKAAFVPVVRELAAQIPEADERDNLLGKFESPAP